MADPIYSKAELSGSTDGRPIKVATNGTPGTTIHTAGAVTGDNNYDEIWLWASNFDTVERLLTLEWGGVTSPDDLILVRVPGLSSVKVAPGWVLQNSLVLRAFCNVANKVSLVGFVNKIRTS